MQKDLAVVKQLFLFALKLPEFNWDINFIIKKLKIAYKFQTIELESFETLRILSSE